MIHTHNVCKTYLMGDTEIRALDHVSLREHSREEIRRLKFAGCGNREIHIFFLLRCGICYLCALPPAALATAGAALWFRRQDPVRYAAAGFIHPI